MMRTVRLTAFLCGLSMTLSVSLSSASGDDAGLQAKRILSQLDSRRGIGVVLGDEEARLAIDLANDSELLVYVQLVD